MHGEGKVDIDNEEEETKKCIVMEAKIKNAFICFYTLTV